MLRRFSDAETRNLGDPQRSWRYPITVNTFSKCPTMVYKVYQKYLQRLQIPQTGLQGSLKSPRWFLKIYKEHLSFIHLYKGTKNTLGPRKVTMWPIQICKGSTPRKVNKGPMWPIEICIGSTHKPYKGLRCTTKSNKGFRWPTKAYKGTGTPRWQKGLLEIELPHKGLQGHKINKDSINVVKISKFIAQKVEVRTRCRIKV